MNKVIISREELDKRNCMQFKDAVYEEVNTNVGKRIKDKHAKGLYNLGFFVRQHNKLLAQFGLSIRASPSVTKPCHSYRLYLRNANMVLKLWHQHDGVAYDISHMRTDSMSVEAVAALGMREAYGLLECHSQLRIDNSFSNSTDKIHLEEVIRKLACIEVEFTTEPYLIKIQNLNNEKNI